MLIDTRLTYDDYCLLPSDGKRYEVIEGELFVTPAPFWRHQHVLTRLLIALGNFVQQHQLGEVVAAPLDVVFSEHDVVQPDMLYISKARASVITKKNIQGAPDLVVEILSESTAKIDRTTKLKIYARYGVAEYWIIDPVECSAEIFRMVQGGCQLAAQLNATQTLTSPLFPGFEFPLSQLRE